MKKGTFKKLLTVLAVLMTHIIYAQTAPVLYYDFDQTNPLAPRVGTGTLNMNGGSYQILPGAVGNSIAQLFQDSLNYTYMTGGTVTPANSETVQMLIKPGYFFLNTRQAYLFQHGNTNATISNISSGSLRFSINFSTRIGTASTTLRYELDGINRKSMQWLLDSAWHHMAFVVNGAAGTMQLYIDGLLTAQQTCPIGNITPASDMRVYINDDFYYDKYFGSYDEIAFYVSALTSQQIYKNYLDFQAGQHYSTAVATSVPSPPVVSGPLDVNDFPIGYTLGSTSSINCTYSALQQLQRFANPRYPFSTTLRRNFLWADPQYYGGYTPYLTNNRQPDITDPQMQSRFLQYELYTKYKYMLIVSNNLSATNTTAYSDTNTYQGKWVRMANQYPTWERSTITFWINTFPVAATAPYQYVLRKITGNPGTDATQYLYRADGTTRIISPNSPTGGLINQSGTLNKTRLTALLAQLVPSRMDFVNENAEVWYLCDSALLAQDPNCVAEKTSLGLSFREYFAYKQRLFSVAYRDTFMQLQPNALYSQYNISGWDGTLGRSYYYPLFSQMKLINRTINGRYYSTMDFYPRYPSNWRTWSGAWHGWASFDEARQVEVAQNCKIFSPFVSAGWNANEEQNQRPGRYLGLLKSLGLYGVDFYYAGFFNEAPPTPHPKGYTHQLTAVSYAQAVLARIDTIVKSGLYIRQVPADYTKPDTGFAVWAGDPRVWCVARRDSLISNHYVITSTIQPSSNMKDQVPDVWAAKAKIAGSYIRFQTRPQGSTYFYVSDSAKFIYLDSWHERIHPDRWTDDVTLQAEVADSSSNGNWKKFYAAKTYTAIANDYTNAYSVLTAADTTERYYYGVYPKANDYYKTYIYARSKSGAGKQFKYVYTDNLGQDSATITLDSDTTFKWYTFNDSSLYSQNGNYRSQLLLLNSGIEIDRVVLTYKDTTLLPAGGSGCTPPFVKVTYTSPFCDSTLATVNASGIVSYQWSTGATTNSIYLTSSQFVTVTITDNLGCQNDTTFRGNKANCDTTCLPPENIQILNIYQYSVRVKFTASTINAYAYQAEIINTSTGATVYEPFNQTNYRIRGLKSNTTYSMRLRTYCLINGVYSYSAWTSPLIFTTL